MQHLQDGIAFAGADIDHFRAGMLHRVIQRLDMGSRQIDDMDIIAHAGAVYGVVVIPENGKIRQLAVGDLGDIGKQVVRDAVRDFADQTALMGADRIEIAQQHRGKLLVRESQICQDAFIEEFGRAVRIGRRAVAVLFLEWRFEIVAVDGRA